MTLAFGGRNVMGREEARCGVCMQRSARLAEQLPIFRTEPLGPDYGAIGAQDQRNAKDQFRPFRAMGSRDAHQSRQYCLPYQCQTPDIDWRAEYPQETITSKGCPTD